MNEHTFCSSLLKHLFKDVQKLVPVEIRKSAWVWMDDAVDCGEFQIPSQDFYWYGDAHCRYDCRFKGWVAYLTKHHQEAWEAMQDNEDNEDKG